MSRVTEILSGTDRKAIERLYLQDLDKVIAENENHAAVALFRNQHDIFEKKGEEAFITSYAQLNEKDRAAFLRFSKLEHLAIQAAARRAKLNVPDDRKNNPYHLETVLEIANAAGVKPADMEKIFNQIQTCDTITNHPTGYLKEKTSLTDQDDGLQHFLDMISITTDKYGKKLTPVQQHNQFVKALKNAATAEHMAPPVKATTSSETYTGLDYALRYINGRDSAIEQIEQAVAKIYHNGKRDPRNPPSITKTIMDLAVRRWDDYDGKPNAEHWTSLLGVVGTTLTSVSLHLSRLEQMHDALKSNGTKKINARDSFSLAALSGSNRPSEKMHEELRFLHELLVKIKTDFTDILKDIEKYYNEIHDPKLNAKQREEKYKELHSEFERIRERTATIYDDKTLRGYGGKNRGLKIYEYMIEELRGLKLGDNEQAIALANASINGLKMDGLTVFKPEPRHNHHDNVRIIDNLFKNTEFLEYLNTQAVLDNRDFKFLSHGKFSDTKKIEQRKFDILDKIEIHFKKTKLRNKFQEFLFKANPDIYDEDGYPDQTRGALERLRVMEMFPLKFGPMFIVAESDKFGARYNKFICSGFNLGNMIHTPLTEYLEDMSRSQADAIMNHGLDIVRSIRELTKVPAQFRRAVMAKMFARSDIQRTGGWASGMKVMEQTQANARQAAGTGKPESTKEGSGRSNERGGGDPMVLIRQTAQALQEWSDERDGEKIPEDVLQMVTMMAVTVQGNETYETAEEIARRKKDQVAEMIGLRLELEGKIERGTFIPQREEFSKEMAALLEHLVTEMMQDYKAFCDVKGKKADNEVLNELMEIISDLKIAKYSNHAARKAGRAIGEKEKVTSYRAIGKNVALALSRAFNDGYFTSGKFLETMHQALHGTVKINNGAKEISISKVDVKKFFRSDQWNYGFFVRTLTAAQRAEFEHGLKRLGMHEELDHKRLMEIAESATIKKGKKKNTLQYKAKGVPETVAYFACIYADHHKLRSATHALIDESFYDPNTSFSEILLTNAPEPGQLSGKFNKASNKRWPWLVDVAEAERRAAPLYALMSAYDRQLKDKQVFSDKISEAEYRAIAAAYKASTAATIRHIVEYDVAQGRRDEPLPKNPLDAIRRVSANDNENHDENMALEA